MKPVIRLRATDFSGVAAPRHLPKRPGVTRRQPRGPRFGRPCPDGGYAFLLAHCSESHLVLGAHDRPEDARWAVATIGVRRAGLAGRAPLASDVDVGRAVLGYDGDAPEAFVEWRTHRLWSIARDQHLEQWLGDLVEAGIDLTRREPPSRDEIERWWAHVSGAVAGDRARSRA
ncbi:MAG TPA: hypothetical protein VGO78_28980 [Acidimicrobiales bacterium]|jgi:hypothetical protein|nr:hypothetical protein [Acidimicrobiales bacterium]